MGNCCASDKGCAAAGHGVDKQPETLLVTSNKSGAAAGHGADKQPETPLVTSSEQPQLECLLLKPDQFPADQRFMSVLRGYHSTPARPPPAWSQLEREVPHQEMFLAYELHAIEFLQRRRMSCSGHGGGLSRYNDMHPNLMRSLLSGIYSKDNVTQTCSWSADLGLQPPPHHLGDVSAVEPHLLAGLHDRRLITLVAGLRCEPGHPLHNKIPAHQVLHKIALLVDTQRLAVIQALVTAEKQAYNDYYEATRNRHA